MKLFKEYDQNQSYLLPPSLNEFVGPEHPARIISDVVDSIDISSITRKYNGGGSTAYHPRMMLKVIIYAYSKSIYSSRRIESELESDTAFMYLSGMQRPDFRTICLFRSEHADAISQTFIEVVRLCASLGMVGLGHISFDGTKLKANASVRETKDKKALGKELKKVKEEIDGLLKRAKEVDETEDLLYGEDNNGSGIPEEIKDREYRLKMLEEAKRELEAEGVEKVNVTDPDARLMKNSQDVIQPGYNGQIAVDSKEQIIVAADITQEATDHHQLQPMVEQVEENLGKLPDQISADAGYSSYDNLEYVENKEIDAYIPDNKMESLDKKEESDKKYDKSNFSYDENADQYTCPEGKSLVPHSKIEKNGRELTVYRGTDCEACPVRKKCTKAEARTVTRDGREPLQEKMREKLRSDEGELVYQQRSYTVEPVFSNMKWNRPKLIMTMRGKRKVKGEFILMCIVHNIGKIIGKVQAIPSEIMAVAG
jgi:transposase